MNSGGKIVCAKRRIAGNAANENIFFILLKLISVSVINFNRSQNTEGERPNACSERDLVAASHARSRSSSSSQHSNRPTCLCVIYVRTARRTVFPSILVLCRCTFSVSEKLNLARKGQAKCQVKRFFFPALSVAVSLLLSFVWVRNI